MKRSTTIFLVLAFLTAGLALYGAAGLLDGKTFDGLSGMTGKEAADKDTLSFADGKLHSSSCDQYGFKPSDYTAHKDEDKIKFESTSDSEKEGKIVWKGTVTGDSIEGTMVWSKSGQKDIEYWFKGSLRK
ncbi:MAG TPA: hypothetical protein VFG11_07545 [Acidobacteriota bacterium]|nr:hypothetical protein [Acidobacteriota bacterium]